MKDSCKRYLYFYIQSLPSGCAYCTASAELTLPLVPHYGSKTTDDVWTTEYSIMLYENDSLVHGDQNATSSITHNIT